MQSFDKYFNQENSVVFSFGRFNPPTIGHERLIEVVNQTANKNLVTSSYIIPTTTQNSKKDPLYIDEKINILNYMVTGDVNVLNISELGLSTWFDVIIYFYNKGLTKLIQVAGSDRINDFETLFDKYNGVPDKSGKLLYNFPDGAYKLVSSGERDPDSSDIGGMSASKLRQLAQSGLEEKFKAGMSMSVPDNVKHDTFKKIQSRLK